MRSIDVELKSAENKKTEGLVCLSRNFVAMRVAQISKQENRDLNDDDEKARAH